MVRIHTSNFYLDVLRDHLGGAERRPAVRDRLGTPLVERAAARRDEERVAAHGVVERRLAARVELVEQREPGRRGAREVLLRGCVAVESP